MNLWKDNDCFTCKYWWHISLTGGHFCTQSTQSNYHCCTNHSQITPAVPLPYPSKRLLNLVGFFCFPSIRKSLVFVSSHSFAIYRRNTVKFEQAFKWATVCVCVCSKSSLTASPPPTLCNHSLLPYLAVCALRTHPTTPLSTNSKPQDRGTKEVHFLCFARHKWSRKEERFLLFLFIRRVQTASAVERKKWKKERTCSRLIY